MEHEIESDEAVSDAVVLAVSAIQGRDPISLPPLGEVVDPDSLDRIFDSQLDGMSRTGGRVSFTYADCYVTIDNGEYLSIDVIGPDRSRPERLDIELENTD